MKSKLWGKIHSFSQPAPFNCPSRLWTAALSLSNRSVRVPLSLCTLTILKKVYITVSLKLVDRWSTSLTLKGLKRQACQIEWEKGDQWFSYGKKQQRHWLAIFKRDSDSERNNEVIFCNSCFERLKASIHRWVKLFAYQALRVSIELCKDTMLQKYAALTHPIPQY